MSKHFRKRKENHRKSKNKHFNDFFGTQTARTVRRIMGSVSNAHNQLKELNWYDKDLDDFDIDHDKEDASFSEEETETAEVNLIAKNARKIVNQQEDVGIRCYPVDIWIALSQHIFPEDIGRFAGICRYSNMVVHTVQFWKHVYMKYCIYNSEELPDDLQPCCLERIHGLRQCVIRSLYYVYPPLVDRTKTTIPFENEPYHLIGHCCILYWYEKVKNMWVFNFKFKEETLSSVKNYLSERKRHYDLIRGHNDLFYNPVSGCCILQVVCQNFIHIPPILGLKLRQIFIKVGHGMRYHCLKLVFNSSVNNQLGSRHSLSDDAVVSIDPAVNLKVFPWWHPKYPFK